MTRAEKNIWQSTAAFEPLRDDQNGLIPRKKPAAKDDNPPKDRPAPAPVAPVVVGSLRLLPLEPLTLAIGM